MVLIFADAPDVVAISALEVRIEVHLVLVTKLALVISAFEHGPRGQYLLSHESLLWIPDHAYLHAGHFGGVIRQQILEPLIQHNCSFNVVRPLDLAVV